MLVYVQVDRERSEKRDTWVMVHREGDSWWWRHRALAARTDWLQQSVQWERRTAAASLSCLHTHNVHRTLFLGSPHHDRHVLSSGRSPSAACGPLWTLQGTHRTFRVRNSVKIALTKSVNKHLIRSYFSTFSGSGVPGHIQRLYWQWVRRIAQKMDRSTENICLNEKREMDKC